MKLAKKFSLIFIFAATLFLTLAFAGVDGAQAPNPSGPTDDQVNAIAKQLYCPVCENIPLDVCGTQACEQWRQLIRQRLGEGWTENQIKDYFVNQYGDRVLATPPARGWNWLVYIFPPLAIVIGAIILWRVFNSWTKPIPEKEQGQAPVAPIQDDYVRRVEEELKSRS
jgi:cytochrome c-type biogenesis protein CcmH